MALDSASDNDFMSYRPGPHTGSAALKRNEMPYAVEAFSEKLVVPASSRPCKPSSGLRSSLSRRLTSMPCVRSAVLSNTVCSG